MRSVINWVRSSDIDSCRPEMSRDVEDWTTVVEGTADVEFGRVVVRGMPEGAWRSTGYGTVAAVELTDDDDVEREEKKLWVVG